MIAELVVAGGIMLAPPGQVTNCSNPEFRQTHLAYCNLSKEPPIGGGPHRRGLLGLGGIGGIL